MICHECGHKNTSDAKFCEECGTKLVKPVKPKTDDNPIIDWWNNRDSNNAIILIIVISALIGLGALGGLISAMSPSHDNNTVSNSQVNTQQPTTTNSQTQHTGSIKFLSHSATRDSIGNYIINGELQNNYDFTVSYVQIHATGYDSSGKVVDTGFSYANIKNIQPGGTSPFKIYLDDPNHQIVRYYIQIQRN